MNGDKLHPTVLDFKQFINKHPMIREQIRKGGRSWQEYYEKWALLDEDDPFWDQFKNEEDKTKAKSGQKKEKHTELLGQLMKLTENMDLDKIQRQADQLNNTITMVQEGIHQFQGNKKSDVPSKEPFNWFRD